MHYVDVRIWVFRTVVSNSSVFSLFLKYILVSGHSQLIHVGPPCLMAGPSPSGSTFGESKALAA